MRPARLATRVAAAAAAAALALLAACVLVDIITGPVPWPMTRPPVEAETTPRRVAVLGDVQKGTGNLARLLEAAAAENVDLVIQTGDIVAGNDEGHYRLAALAFRRCGLRVPVAVAPGNHDIKGDPGRFERAFGPLEWSFRSGRLFFVILNNASGDPPDTARLKERLAAAPPGCIPMVVTHASPLDERGGVVAAYGPFVEWLRGSRVRYLLCGHVHDYVRRLIGETVVVANGVGGDYESWNLGQKAYMTILEVEAGDGTDPVVTDRRVELPPTHGLWANFEHLALGHVGEAYRTRPWLCWPATALLAGLAAAAFLATRDRPRAGVTGNGARLP